MTDSNLHCDETLDDDVSIHETHLQTPPRDDRLSPTPLIAATPGKYIAIVNMTVHEAAFQIFLFDLCTALGDSIDASGVSLEMREWAYSIVTSM